MARVGVCVYPVKALPREEDPTPPHRLQPPLEKGSRPSRKPRVLGQHGSCTAGLGPVPRALLPSWGSVGPGHSGGVPFVAFHHDQNKGWRPGPRKSSLAFQLTGSATSASPARSSWSWDGLWSTPALRLAGWSTMAMFWGPSGLGLPRGHEAPCEP